eukprot:gene11910-10293_t
MSGANNLRGVPLASPRNVTFVQTLFKDPDGETGYRDPSAPVFDGTQWHVWATRVNDTEGGYHGEVWHLYSPGQDIAGPWVEGGPAVARGPAGAGDGWGTFTPSVAWEGPGAAPVP